MTVLEQSCILKFEDTTAEDVVGTVFIELDSPNMTEKVMLDNVTIFRKSFVYGTFRGMKRRAKIELIETNPVYYLVYLSDEKETA